MKIITKNPVYTSGAEGYIQYSNGDGLPTSSPIMPTISAPKPSLENTTNSATNTKTSLANKFKGVTDFLKDSGLLQAGVDLGKTAISNQQNKGTTTITPNGTTTINIPTGQQVPDQSSQGMSTGAKIGIGLGILAVVGTAIYFIAKKKKK